MPRMDKAVLDNLSFTLSVMSGLRSCKTLALGEGSFLLATGTEAASENWAFVPSPSLNKAIVQRALPFFEALKLPFIWPVLPTADDEYRRLLEESGLPKQGSLTAMARRTSPVRSPKTDLTCEPVRTREEAALWAEIAWRAFDSPPGAPAAFVYLAQELFTHGSFVLTIARRDTHPAGTYLLSLSGAEAGVYYFATLPEMRRNGVGAAMMNAILNFAAGRSIDLVTLQATPAGTPFYASQSFQKLFDIPVHSPTSDIF